MLVLSRKLNESIIIDGRIKVKVCRLDRDTVKLGIEAPAEIPVHREEVFNEIDRESKLKAAHEKHAATVAPNPANDHLPRPD